MKIKVLFHLTVIVFFYSSELLAQNFGSTSNNGRWIKIARVQNKNPIDGGEKAQITGTVYSQTDIGQTGSAQYIAHFSFGSRGGIKPLLVEFGDASNRAGNDPSRIEWRIYKDPNGWHYLWFWQSNYSRFVDFQYKGYAVVEHWSIENPPSVWTMVWSSLDGDRQGMVTGGDTIFKNGNVGIGTTNPTTKLTINGTANAEEIIVEENIGADFVFEADYTLPVLSEVESFIKEHGHLSGIPSAEEMKREGVKVGELQIKLLQKIEELTLFLIRHEDRIQKLESENKELKILLGIVNEK